MIKFFKLDSAIEFPTELEVWAEVNNFHMDEKLSSATSDDVGMLYLSKKFEKSETFISEAVIWDADTGNIWIIYDEDGRVLTGTEKANKLVNYAKAQFDRLVDMRRV